MSHRLVANAFAPVLTPALPPWGAPRLLDLLRRLVTELRVDVHLPEVELALELQRLYPLGHRITEAEMDRLNVRAVLLGRGCSLPDFVQAC